MAKIKEMKINISGSENEEIHKQTRKFNEEMLEGFVLANQNKVRRLKRKESW